MSNKPKKLEQTLTNWALDLMNSHDLDFKGLLDKLPSLRPDKGPEPLPRDPSDEELEWESFKSEVGGYSVLDAYEEGLNSAGIEVIVDPETGQESITIKGKPWPVETSDGEIDAVVDENGKIHWK